MKLSRITTDARAFLNKSFIFQYLILISQMESSYIIFHFHPEYYLSCPFATSSKWTTGNAVILHFYWINKSIYNLFSEKNSLECFLLSAFFLLFLLRPLNNKWQTVWWTSASAFNHYALKSLYFLFLFWNLSIFFLKNSFSFSIDIVFQMMLWIKIWDNHKRIR